MSVIGLHGIPGCGKTASSVAIALKHYKKTNSVFKRFIRYIKKEDIIINNVYTNFPILLDKKHNIYSNIVSIYDLDNSKRFLKNSIIIIDEVQSFFDSYRDFKKFPSSISTFFQFHRHFEIKDIYVISQHPRRIITYIRDVISEYHRIKSFKKIKLLGIGLVCYKICYEFEDYTSSFTRDKEYKKLLQIKTRFYVFKLRKVFKRFKSRYLEVFNKDKPYLNDNYTSFDIPDNVVEFLNNKLFND